MQPRPTKPDLKHHKMMLKQQEKQLQADKVVGRALKPPPPALQDLADQIAQSPLGPSDDQALWISSSGSKKVPMYADLVLQGLGRDGRIRVCAQDRALGKMVAVIEKVKAANPKVASRSRVGRTDGRDTLESVLSV